MRCSSFSFIFGIFLIRAQGKLAAHNLTTAKPEVQTSARPTTLHRGVIEIGRDEEKSSTKDIFSPKARRSAADIWDWDFWCQMQPKTGNCKNNISKYYYEAQIDQCILFSYTGCKGNENQFDTKVDCERHCKGATYMPVKNLDDSSECPLQPSAGLCLGYFPMYYYDINTQTCKTFVYGGCGGNKNRFGSDVQCMQKCGSPTRKDETYEFVLRKKKNQDSDESDEGFWDPSTDSGVTVYESNPEPEDVEQEEDSAISP